MKQSQIMTFGFLGMLGILTVASALAPEKGFSETENRYLQKKAGVYHRESVGRQLRYRL